MDTLFIELDWKQKVLIGMMSIFRFFQKFINYVFLK